MPFQKGQSGNSKGRPRKAEKFARPIARAEKQIADHLPNLIANMLTLANGVLVEDENPTTGKLQTYQKPPDRQANEYLINRILGKPIERQEITGENRGPIQVEGYDYNAAITPIAARSSEDSDPSGEDASAGDG